MRKPRRWSAPPPTDDAAEQRDLESVRAFQEWAVHLARWQWQRADAFERKAGVLLGAVAVVFTLSPGLAGAVANLEDGWLGVGAGFVAVALVSFLVAAVFSTLTLAAQKSAYAHIQQVRAGWLVFKNAYESRRYPEAVRGQFADQLLGPERDDAPVVLLRDDADRRASRFQVATWAFLIGVISTALSSVTVAVERIIT